MKKLSGAFLVAGGLLIAGCAPSGGTATGCVGLCTSDAACMRALAQEGIAPEGSTKDDRGLCNGICSTLRTMRKQETKQAAAYGLKSEWNHPCLPAAS
jgi:hypothetical protein